MIIWGISLFDYLSSLRLKYSSYLHHLMVTFYEAK